MKSGINYEFRTTIYPKYISLGNVIKIANYLSNIGCKEYFLQNYYDYNNQVKPYSYAELEKMRIECEKYLPTIIK